MLDLQGRGASWSFASEAGAFYVAHIQGRTPGYTVDHWPTGSEGLWEEELGDRVQRWKPLRLITRQGDHVVVVSFWFVTVLLAVWPAKWVWRGKQWAQGLCGRCGYDLRATPDRCPECGLAKQPVPKEVA